MCYYPCSPSHRMPHAWKHGTLCPWSQRPTTIALSTRGSSPPCPAPSWFACMVMLSLWRSCSVMHPFLPCACVLRERAFHECSRARWLKVMCDMRLASSELCPSRSLGLKIGKQCRQDAASIYVSPRRPLASLICTRTIAAAPSHCPAVASCAAACTSAIGCSLYESK